MKRPPFFILSCLASIFYLLTPSAIAMAAEKITYPQTRRVDHLDTYHGVEVQDPYRWLEEDVRESEEVAAWVAAQNELSFGHLATIGAREPIVQRLQDLWDYEKYGPPFKKGGRYYYYKNDGLQNQSVLYAMETLDSEPRVLIDPNTWSADGTVALAGTSFDQQGKHLAFGRSESGSDWRTWRVMAIESGEVLEDQLQWVKFNSPSWSKDGGGFFYGRFPEPAEGDQYQNLNYNHAIYYHQLGTPQSEDVLIHRRPDQPEWGFGQEVSEDGRYLVITVWRGTDPRYRILYKDLQDPDGEIVELIDNFEHEYSFIGNNGPLFFFQNNTDAPRGRVIAIDIGQPQPEHWQLIIPQAEATLSHITLVGDHLVANYMQDAKTQVQLFKLDGTFVRQVDFPGIGTAYGFGGRQDDTETFYSFSSFATPPSIYRYDIASGESQLLRQAQVDFNPDDYEIKQVFYHSGDGTRVPMFITHRKGIALDGSNPTLLYGYGGFNISLTPGFSVAKLAWMELGGIYAQPNLRGGGEYGKAWHKAGTKLNKQNVFDDFIAAAQWLIDQNYTRPAKLAIQGGSNGGLLVGAVMAQRPDLFGACLPAVGVMDMLRFHQFTAGRYWVDDYGSAEDAEEFKALLAYSPYHNLKVGTAYPPTLVTTADTDDRVVPGHSFKFAAALQHAHHGTAPVLIRIETRAGHGMGKPTEKQIEEVGDMWSFLVEHLGMDLAPPVPQQ